MSLNELFAAVRAQVGGTLEPQYAEPRAGDVRDSQADIGKAQRLLGYQPLVDFAAGLEQTVAWYRATAHATIP